MPNPKVTVGFDGTKVTITNGDVSVDQNKTIDFELSSGSSAGAKVWGVEFAKAGEPSGTLAPSEVFDHEHDLIINNITHKLFGVTQGNNNLKLIDTDKTPKGGTDQTYNYAVWVKDSAGNYHKSDDPAIINKPVK